MLLANMNRIHIRLFQNIPASELRITIPTILTLTRIGLVPCIIATMFLQAWGWACALFCLASVTDFLDGKLARYLHAKTFLGACLDPIADKLLVVSFFFSLVFLRTPLFQLPLWFVMMLLLKELAVIVAVAGILLSGRYLPIEPTWLGKSTTALQMIFIMWLFACYYLHWMPIKTYYFMLIAMTVMTIAVCVQYVHILCMRLLCRG